MMTLPIERLPDGRIRLIDQTQLPAREVYVETPDYRQLAEAIREMRVRGAPLIGITAAYAMALAAGQAGVPDKAALLSRLRDAADELRDTRPTAVNLAWALDRCLRVAETAANAEAAAAAVEAEARRIHEDDIAACRAIGGHGAALLPERVSILTHCNTGSLATGGYGTALGVVRAAREQGKLEWVYANESRPRLQGAKLTAWELQREGTPYSLVVDGAAGSLLRQGDVQAVVVGADRVAANGDVANKIGTYALAVLARENGVPFYVAAPTSTIDPATARGDDIPIEERASSEVTEVSGVRITVEDAPALNPAFDVTPAAYVTAIVTERGACRPPYQESLAEALSEEVAARG